MNLATFHPCNKCTSVTRIPTLYFLHSSCHRVYHDAVTPTHLGKTERKVCVMLSCLSASFTACLSTPNNMRVTHLTHTSSGSIHSVISRGRPRSPGLSSLSAQAFRTTSSHGIPSFMLIHLSGAKCKRSTPPLSQLDPYSFPSESSNNKQNPSDEESYKSV